MQNAVTAGLLLTGAESVPGLCSACAHMPIDGSLVRVSRADLQKAGGWADIVLKLHSGAAFVVTDAVSAQCRTLVGAMESPSYWVDFVERVEKEGSKLHWRYAHPVARAFGDAFQTIYNSHARQMHTEWEEGDLAWCEAREGVACDSGSLISSPLVEAAVRADMRFAMMAMGQTMSVEATDGTTVDADGRAADRSAATGAAAEHTARLTLGAPHNETFYVGWSSDSLTGYQTRPAP